MNDDEEFMRYTNGQRCFESKTETYEKRRKKFREQPIITNIIKKLNNNTYIKLTNALKMETELSKYNSKSYIKEKYTDYISKRNENLFYLLKCYENKLFRILHWFSYINKQKNQKQTL